MKTLTVHLIALLLIAGGFAPNVAIAANKPNFIVIYCDDLGYADIGCFGSTKHRTPRIDQMAKEGRRFTSFMVTSGVCSPSRASLMTGCYPIRVGLDRNESNGWVLFPGNKRGLNPKEITVAEVLKGAGYSTAIVGKWHLGDQPQFLPTRQGFDSYFGIPFSNDMGQTERPKPYRYPPLPLLRDEKVIEQEPDQRLLTQRYTTEAVKFIEANKDKPFFLYLPHTMPHWPQFSSKNFAGKSKNGRWGDTVEEIDWSTGVLLDTLKRLDIDDRTLVIFTSDNGGATRWGASNHPLKGAKGSTLEGGMRVCNVMRWPGMIPAGTQCDELVGTIDILPTFAKLAGAKAPDDRVIDGHDISDLMLGKPNAKSPHEAYYYYFRDQLQAVRSGKWKLHLEIKLPPRGRQKERHRPAQLYDLHSDIGESKNVITQHPNVVNRLNALADKTRADLGDRGVKGANVRAPGHVENAKPLTQRTPAKSK